MCMTAVSIIITEFDWEADLLLDLVMQWFLFVFVFYYIIIIIFSVIIMISVVLMLLL